MKRILILHGWMHSAERYAALADNVEDASVYVYEFAGFGNTPYTGTFHLLNTYASDLREHLRSHMYDIIVAHSMGCNVLLRVIDQVNKCKVVLINPVYHGIPKIALVAVPGIFIKQILPDLPIKLLSLLTVNKWADIDELMVRDVRRANPMVAAKSLLEMVFDRYRVSPVKSNTQVLIIRSQCDRVIPERNVMLLTQDIGRCVYRLYPKVGHTPVIECFDILVSDINDMEVNE